jgi:protein-L-isoaspartate(D-aspartate) O-methyltransferase
MVGIMAEALDVKPGQKILEVGAGSGYHAAVIGEMIGPSGHLYSVERIADLASRAMENLDKVGLSEIVTIIHNDGSVGLAEYAPYDRIFVTCASPGIPPPLIEQMVDGGKLLIPSGSSYVSELILVTKSGKKVKKRNLGGCAFVPLRGKYGFQ